ncbi:adenosylmethionine decarboxylase [Chitinibacteraceae bacterium HSL-7]
MLGQHLIADLSGCTPDVLADPLVVEALLRRAAHLGQATVLHGHFHHFGDGLGVTGVLLLMESHISIHTWPEHGFAAVDLFMCGAANADAALASLVADLGAGTVTRQRIARGVQ